MTNPAETDLAIELARLGARLDGIKSQLDQAERNQQQVAKLTEERWAQRFDSIDRRLVDMDAARAQARKDDQHAREQIELKQTAIELRVTSLEKFDHSAVLKDVEALKSFKTTLIGICIGVGAAGGGIAAAIVNAVGGA